MKYFEMVPGLGALLFLTSMITPTPCMAEPVRAGAPITTKYEYYDIQGKTKDDLRRSMRRQSARFTGGEYDAYTDWNIVWNYKSGGAPCGVTSSQVSLDITYHMPQWKDAPGPLSGLRRQWNGFVKALQKHEDGHGRIGTDCFHAVEKAIQKVGSYSNCGQLDGRLREAVNNTIAEYRRKEYDYDAKTEHGMKQGAAW